MKKIIVGHNKVLCTMSIKTTGTWIATMHIGSYVKSEKNNVVTVTHASHGEIHRSCRVSVKDR